MSLEDGKIVNPHFEEPNHPLHENNLQHVGPIEIHPGNYPVQPCPSCGHCPTCGRGPSYPVYRGPWWGVQPGTVICTTTSGVPGDGNL